MTKYTDAQKELARKWAMGEVTHTRVQKVLKKTSMGAYVALALMLRDIVKENSCN